MIFCRGRGDVVQVDRLTYSFNQIQPMYIQMNAVRSRTTSHSNGLSDLTVVSLPGHNVVFSPNISDPL